MGLRNYYRSEGFMNGIFSPWALWFRAARCESCWDVAAAAVTWKLGSETVLVFGLNRSHMTHDMRDPGSSVGASCVKFRRASFLKKIKKIRKKHISYISRILENWKNPISNISRIGLNQKIRFPIFPGFWRMLQTSISNISRRATINSKSCSI